jgi:23S rRNA pseudouridine2605 synthase
MERLQKILSQAGIASRRAGEQLMLQGRVTVNGVTVRELGTKADAARDDIRVDGRRVKAAEQHRYILLNKPRGYVTTRSDPQKRPTVIDLLRAIPEYVYPVGRLDFDTEGLLILTNDGELAASLIHPRHGVVRVYEARVLGVPDAHDLDRLARGIVIDGERTAPAEVKMISRSPLPAPKRDGRAEGQGRPSARVYARARGLPARGGGAPRALDKDDGHPAVAPKMLLEITVREGRNRQVRKMCEAIGHPVAHLKRVAIGPLRDSRLKIGYWRDLEPEEVARLRKAVAVPAAKSAAAPAKPKTLDRAKKPR